MKFTKYDKYGAYHHKQYAKGGRYKRHADRIKDWVKERKVLDIGAGDGLITVLLGIVGVDNEPKAVQLAQEKGALVVLGDAYALDFETEQFDSALMIDVLEHFEFPREALREARRILKKYLYIVTPPKKADGTLTDKFHYQEWTAEGLQEIVESADFELEGEIVTEGKSMYAKFKKV